MDNISIYVWDTSKIFGVGETLRHRLNDMTWKLLRGFYPKRPKVIEDLNDLYNINDNHTHTLVIASGCLIMDPVNFGMGIQKQILSGYKLHGQLLGYNDHTIISLHEQMFLIDNNLLKEMKENEFVFSNSVNFSSNTWPDIIRSEENVHDDYTPKQIHPGNGTTKTVIKSVNKSVKGVLEDLIEYCILNGHSINNLNERVRDSKLYSYHVNDPIQFREAFGRLDPTLTNQYGQKNFIKHFLTNGKFFAYNTQDNLLPHRGKKDCIITVGSGWFPWLIMARLGSEECKVLIVDILPENVKFQEWFLQTYDPVRYKDYKWSDIISEYGFKGIHRGLKDLSDTRWEFLKQEINEKWDRIKSYDIKTKIGDIIQYDSEISNYIKSSQNPFVWFSNCFYYSSTSYKTYDMKDYLQRLIRDNRNVAWEGVSDLNLISSSPYKWNNTSFFQKADIPPFDVNEFMEEIQNLEKNNLFVEHRTSDSQGWESFCIHGRRYDATADVGNVGGQMVWTREAKIHCPKITEYVRSSNIKSEYHRVRIMKLLPGGYINIHNDDFEGMRSPWALNIAVNNPKDCEMHFWDQRFSYLGKVRWRPGVAFKLRIQYNHIVRNLSNETRYHIIVHGTGGDFPDTL